MELAEVEALASQIVDWAGHLAAGTAAWLAMIARFDAAEGYARWECQSCAHWLNWQCGLEIRSAREHVRVARRLLDLPVLRGAFERGEVSYSKVRAVTRVAEPDTEADLLMLAVHSTAAQLERIVAACVRVGRYASPDQARARHEARGVFHGWDEDGSMTISARLRPETGAVLLQALAHAEKAPPAEARREELAARRADALGLVAGAYLDGAYDAATHERYQVVVHVDADVLAADTRTGPPQTCGPPTRPAPSGGGPGTDATTSGERPEPSAQRADPSGERGDGVGRCHLEHGPSLAAETVRRLACDATMVTIIDGADGEPIGIGRRSRRVPARLRRFLYARDGGCRFPGCTNRRTHAHHLHHWTAGGPTDPENLLLLCSFHHHRLHEGGWTAHRKADGHVEFRDQFGLRLGSTAPPEGSAEHLRALPVQPGAIACRWAGERLDLDHITTSLLNPPSTRWPIAVAQLE